MWVLGFELGFSCFYSKFFYLGNHLPNPMDHTCDVLELSSNNVEGVFKGEAGKGSVSPREQISAPQPGAHSPQQRPEVFDGQ